MRRLNRYIGKSVLLASLGSLLVLIALNIVASFVVSIGDVDEKYTLSRAFLVILFRSPGMFIEFLPYGVFLGCIIGLGIHANNNELSVVRSAGVSVYRLLWAVMRPTLFIIVAGLLVSEYVNPRSNQLVRSLQVESGIRETQTDASHDWYRDTDQGEFIHFERVETGGRIYGVTRFGLDEDGNLQYAGVAEQAIYQQDGYWQLENYRQSNIYSDRVELSGPQTQVWRTQLSPQLLNILVLPPEALGIRDLYRYAVYRDNQNLESHDYWLWFWQRVLQPVTVLTLVLVGISFIFGSFVTLISILIIRFFFPNSLASKKIIWFSCST